MTKTEMRQTIFSPCRTYRYTLWREWIGGEGYAMFVGLNPSTADETQDDPTIRRCIAFAKPWGYSGLCMTNLFAFRATDPKDMRAAAEPVGPENDAHLRALAQEAGVIVAAWGANGTHKGRDLAVRKLLPALHCLALTKEGHPGHPLYLRKTIQKHIENPPYGTSKNITAQGGVQYNHRINNFLKGKNVFTFGSEYISDDILDEIPSYRYLIDQTTTDWGTFAQSDWEILPSLNLLSGIRMDRHNLIDNLLWSRRASLLYKYKGNTQFRLGYGTGFRAPQAFDTDLHIAFAGGGVSSVQLDPNLKQENSQSFSASVNYHKTTDKYIAGFYLRKLLYQIR